MKDSSSGGHSEVLRSLHNQYAFSGRGGVTPAHVAVDLRRRSKSPDPNLEGDVLRVIGELRDKGHVTGGTKLASPVSLTGLGQAAARHPNPPAIVGGQGSGVTDY